MALATVPPLSEEAEIISIENDVENKRRRHMIIMECTDPDTGKPFMRSSKYCEATEHYLGDMTEKESNKHQLNLRQLGELGRAMSAHPASGNLPAGETLRKLHLVSD